MRTGLLEFWGDCCWESGFVGILFNETLHGWDFGFLVKNEYEEGGKVGLKFSEKQGR